MHALRGTGRPDPPGDPGRQLPPAAALRDAQLSLLNDPRWSNPHYWAAFGLQGEWK